MERQLINTNFRSRIEQWGELNSEKISLAKELILVILDELFPKIIGIDWFQELWEYREIVATNTVGKTTIYLSLISNVLIIQIFNYFKQLFNYKAVFEIIISFSKMEFIQKLMKYSNLYKKLLIDYKNPKPKGFGCI